SLLFAMLGLVCVWVGSSIYRRYTGFSRGQSMLLWLLAVGLAVGLMIGLQNQRDHRGEPDLMPIEWACLILLPLLAVPFAAKLYDKWIGDHLTDAEKLPGIDGVRAWLGVGNVVCAGLIPICVWQLFGYSPVGILALTFGALLVYPLLRMASDSARPT